MRAWVLGLAALVAGCDLLPDDSGLRTENHVTWVTVRGDHVPVLNPGTAMDRAAIGVQRTWPNLAAAEAAVSPRWTAAHPQNSFLGALNGRPPHGELVGFGATLVRQSNTDFPPGPEDFPAATGDLNRPTLLFFDMRAGGDPANWPIIGMGYAFPYKDEDEVARLLTESRAKAAAAFAAGLTAAALGPVWALVFGRPEAVVIALLVQSNQVERHAVPQKWLWSISITQILKSILTGRWLRSKRLQHLLQAQSSLTSTFQQL